MTELPTVHSTPPNSSVPSPAPSGFARAARRLGNWASNLLVSGVILVVGLVFGREVVQWWGTPSPPGEPSGAAAPSTTQVVPLATPSIGDLHDLTFGDLPIALRHGTVVGDETAVLAELRRQCAAAADVADPGHRELSDAQQRMLAGLARQTPVAHLDGRWEMYELPRPLPMVSVVSGSSQTVIDARRVLSWGMAFPAVGGDDEAPHWTWFAWCAQPAAPEQIEAQANWPQPPGSRRAMTLRSPDGLTLAAFTGSDRAANWQDYVDNWMRERGAVAMAAWSHQGARHQRPFERPGVGRYVMHITESGSGALQGFITLTPTAAQP